MVHQLGLARLVTCGTLTLCIFALGSNTTTAEPAIRIPSFTAYAEPNVHEPRISSRGVRPWSNTDNGLAWYGQIAQRGQLGVAVDVRVPEGETVQYRMTVEKVGGDRRSEEHTPELPSRRNLVCPLLLEKKNTIYDTDHHL